LIWLFHFWNGTNPLKMPVMMEKKEHHGGQAMQIMKHGMFCKQYTHLPEI
jgi:hypothetical protein